MPYEKRDNKIERNNKKNSLVIGSQYLDLLRLIRARLIFPLLPDLDLNLICDIILF